MKSKRLLLVVVLIVIMVICWLVGIRKLSGVDEKIKQATLIAQADAFMERELYIRAIPLYEEAVAYNVEAKKLEIEGKLLEAYEKSGSITSYNKLVQKRIANRTATEEEYCKLATNYLDHSKYRAGLDVLIDGVAYFDSINKEASDLNKLYESKRYTYKKRSTEYTDVILTPTNSVLAVYNGSKWGYVSNDNTEVLPCIYDRATAMTEAGYSFVTYAGDDYTINKIGQHYSINDGKATEKSEYKEFEELVTAELTNRLLGVVDGKYGYYNPDFELMSEQFVFDYISGMDSTGAAVKNDNKWFFINTSGNVTSEGQEFDDVAINSLGCAFSGERACVKNGSSWYVVDKTGEKIISEGFDDIKAPEGDSESYIAVCKNGKWGFIDSTGNLVIDCIYKDAYSFSDNVAAVQKTNDEWTYISMSGEDIMPLELFKWASPFHNGFAATGNMEGKITFLKFRYYETE